MKYKQGQILQDKEGNQRKILAVCGELVFLSNINDFGISSGYNWTEEQIVDKGYTPIEEPWDESCVFIDVAGEVIRLNRWLNTEHNNCIKNFLGVYRTESEAQKVADKVREFVKTLK